MKCLYCNGTIKDNPELTESIQLAIEINMDVYPKRFTVETCQKCGNSIIVDKKFKK